MSTQRLILSLGIDWRGPKEDDGLKYEEVP